MTRKIIKKWLYGSCPGFAGCFPYFGTKVYFPKRSWSFLAACQQGIFEADNVRLLQGLSRPETWFFDVGANIGLMSVPVLHAAPSVSVLSFEPSPNVLEFLKRTIATSVYRDRWTLVPKAVGEFVGRANFCLAKEEQSLFDGLKATRRVPTASGVEVEITTVDTEWNRLGRPEVSLIKIDVEGGEFAVLKGARECVSHCKPNLLLEWNVLNLAAYDCLVSALLAFSREVGYRVFALPHIIPVTDERELRLHLLRTENFLLCE